MKAVAQFEAMVSHGIEINCYIVSYLLQCSRKLGKTSEVIVHLRTLRIQGSIVMGLYITLLWMLIASLGIWTRQLNY